MAKGLSLYEVSASRTGGGAKMVIPDEVVKSISAAVKVSKNGMTGCSMKDFQELVGLKAKNAYNVTGTINHYLRKHGIPLRAGVLNKGKELKWSYCDWSQMKEEEPEGDEAEQ